MLPMMSLDISYVHAQGACLKLTLIPAFKASHSLFEHRYLRRNSEGACVYIEDDRANVIQSTGCLFNLLDLRYFVPEANTTYDYLRPTAVAHPNDRYGMNHQGNHTIGSHPAYVSGI